VRLTDRLLRRTAAPAGSTGALEAGEEVLAVAAVRAGYLVATRLGVWVPGAAQDAGPLRVRWELVSKATWDGETLELTVSEETGTAGAAVLLVDVLVRSYALADPGALPQVVNQRVTGSVRSSHRRELPGGGAWFVQRSVPGRDGVVLQVRVDPGTDLDVVTDIAAAVASHLPGGAG
jgi:hypothetical protein